MQEAGKICLKSEIYIYHVIDAQSVPISSTGQQESLQLSDSSFDHKHSRPSSRSWMHISEFSSSFCTFSTCFMLPHLIKERNVASAFAISFVFCSSWEVTFFWCINFENSDHGLDFDSASGPEIKDNRDSRTLMVTASTCFKVLITDPVSIFAKGLLRFPQSVQIFIDLRMRGCCLEGKLFERAWKEGWTFKGDVAICFGVEKKEGRSIVFQLTQAICCLLPLPSAEYISQAEGRQEECHPV
ncbi:hypothetical protein F3Y22_tig00110328pilonHSYRG00967 [Hibiscus syriacus]|uniref:Uncharacterized protein n=1 Tax=Hibiscus syriacus TaxID=106335 RepID=A0A6A3B181_HIBSY|nr:hypothetical protein F3Y22_tig00110328pilonHSYRG00967 [Hibiscus syriacus]